MRHPICLPAILVAAILCTATCLANEKETVTIAYVIAPPRPLPDGLKAVAVIDSGVETKGTKQDDRERKWSNIAADMIEAMLQNSSISLGSNLNVAKRRETKHVLEERDLRLSGMVATDQAAQAGKLLAVQGLIVSRITINLDVQKNTKSTVDWTAVLGGVTQGLMNGGHREPAPRPGYVVQPPPPPPLGQPARVYRDSRPPTTNDPRYRVYRAPGGAPATVYRGTPSKRGYLYDPSYAGRRGYVVQPVAPPQPGPAAGGMISFGTREVEEISRHLTVQCSFCLIDAVTGKALIQYSPPPYQKTDTQSPDFLFGGMMDAGQLDPVDNFIGELIERATQEFVGLLVPTRVEYTCTVIGKHTASEAGVRSLRADDYEGALNNFQKELMKRSDEHEAMFALGVTCELMGEPQKALEWYRRASAAEDVNKEELAAYSTARKRLTDHLGRIVPSTPPGVPSPAPQTAPQ